MDDRTLIRTGTVGAVIAAICCATPVVVILLGAVGLSAWAAGADLVLIPVLLACLALVALGVVRRQRAKARCADGSVSTKGLQL
jgi:mercuric ion transport protein